MHILILYRHFWPDSPPYASMLRSIGRELANDGHEITIWAEDPCYKARDYALDVPRKQFIDGMTVERFAHLPDRIATGPMRLLDKLLFVPRLLLKAICCRARGDHYDLVWTATIPPVLQGWAGRTIAWLFNAKFLYHCQDLYPELAGHMDIWPRGRALYRIMAFIERKNRTRADMLVTLSEDMATTVRALGTPRKLAVINNFALEDLSSTAEKIVAPKFDPEFRSDGKIQLIFAGNIGSYQGLDTVVEAMRLIENDCPSLELLLLGEGKALPDLMKRAADLRNVRFESHRPFEEAQALIAAADIGLVTLAPEIYRYAFPSKTLTYLGLGVPIFAIVEPDSKLCEQIQKQGLGWLTGARDEREIAMALKEIAQSWNRDEQESIDPEHLKQSVSRASVLTRWREIIFEMSA